MKISEEDKIKLKAAMAVLEKNDYQVAEIENGGLLIKKFELSQKTKREAQKAIIIFTIIGAILFGLKLYFKHSGGLLLIPFVFIPFLLLFGVLYFKQKKVWKRQTENARTIRISQGKVTVGDSFGPIYDILAKDVDEIFYGIVRDNKGLMCGVIKVIGHNIGTVEIIKFYVLNKFHIEDVKYELDVGIKRIKNYLELKLNQ